MSVSPGPPVAVGLALPWDAPVENPVAALAEARRSLGDTFVVHSGDDQYLFTFSPAGVSSFYALPEDRASKGVADWRMLRRKLPDELFAGRRTMPHQLFGRDDVASYLANVERALDVTVEELGTSGEVDVFALTARLGHRVGLSSWGGPGSASGDRFDRLAEAFAVLDGAESFVHPDAMAAIAASGKRAEREALDVIVALIGEAYDQLPGSESEHELFTRIALRWGTESPRDRRMGTALDVALIHLASMSNLFAAIGWQLIDLFEHADEATRVGAGDVVLARQCVLESTRLAQRSIMARYVVAPVSLDVGTAVYDVAAGITIATLLPLTNTSAEPGLDQWDPGRWSGRRLADSSRLAAVELVTTFGHGRHTCPAQTFSLAAMTTAAARLLASFEFAPQWRDRPGPVRAQIGGVARAAGPCLVRYRN